MEFAKLQKAVADLFDRTTPVCNRVESRTFFSGAAVFVLSSVMFAVAWHSDNWVERIGKSMLLGLGTGSFVAVAYLVPAYLVAEKRWRAQVRAVLSESLAAPEIRTAMLHTPSKCYMVQRLRKRLRVITRKFACSLCGRAVRVERAGTTTICRKCRCDLRVPYSPCPTCGNAASIIVSPQEQVPPPTSTTDNRGKLAGGLMYGPAGLIGGAVVDGVNRSISNASKEGFRVLRLAFASHKYRCSACGYLWATLLPPVD